MHRNYNRNFLFYSVHFLSLAEATYAIYSVALENDDEMNQTIIDADSVPILVKLLSMDNDEVISSSLGCLRAIAECTVSATDTLLECGFLELVPKLLDNSYDRIAQEATRTVSIITDEGPTTIQAVIDAGILESIVRVLENGGKHTKVHAARIIKRIAAKGNTEQMTHLIEKVCVLKPLCSLLDAENEEACLLAVKGFNALLASAKDQEDNGILQARIQAIIECGAIEKLQALQMQKNTRIYQEAYSLLDAYSRDGNLGDAKRKVRKVLLFNRI